MNTDSVVKCDWLGLTSDGRSFRCELNLGHARHCVAIDPVTNDVVRLHHPSNGGVYVIDCDIVSPTPEEDVIIWSPELND